MIKSQKGFTIIEIVVVIGISLMLFGAVTFNLLRTQSNTSTRSNLEKLLSDIRAQQAKAMTGATEGRTTTDSFGIYFSPDSYVLFHGNTYNPNDTSNFIVNLPQDLEIESTAFPNNSIIFSAISGEIIGFSGSNNTVTLRSVNTNQEVEVTLNRYGVIIGTN